MKPSKEIQRRLDAITRDPSHRFLCIVCEKVNGMSGPCITCKAPLCYRCGTRKGQCPSCAYPQGGK